MNSLFRLFLKGSAVSALALLTAAVGCSDSDSNENPPAVGGEPGNAGGKSNTGGGSVDEGGEPSTSGAGGAGGAGGAAGMTSEGGAAGAGGAPDQRPDIVFSEGGETGAGGAGGANNEPAVAKFCNSLTFGTDDDPMDVTMILEIGEGADKVSFTAISGTCAPMDGDACSAIPLGDAVPVALFDADAPDVPLDAGMIKSRGGASWVFWTDLTNEASPSPIVVGSPFESPACEDIIYEDVFGP